MAENTKINWADNTFNPWEGCTACSPGCDNCYAEAQDARCLREDVSHWGKGVPRRLTSDTNWAKPLAWNRAAEASGTRPRVFCGSLCDWADAEAPAGALDRLWELIRQTPHLNWLLLTKRHGRVEKSLPSDWGQGYANVWLGVTCEDREHGLPRLDVLRGIHAVCRFVSFEPLVEDLGTVDLTGISWAIVGGESGNNARPFRAEWAESLLDQCRNAGTSPWIKQMGAKPIYREGELSLADLDSAGRWRQSRNGEDWNLWPESLAHLKVREVPRVDPADPEGWQERNHGERIEAMVSSLDALAARLGTDECVARGLHNHFVECERRLFLNRRERGAILFQLREVYKPHRLWGAFLLAVGIPKQRAHDWIKLVTVESPESGLLSEGSDSQTEEVEAPDEAEELNTEAEVEDSEVQYPDHSQSPRRGLFLVTTQPVVNEAIPEAVQSGLKAIRRVFAKLPVDERSRAAEELVQALLAEFVEAA